MSARSSSAMHVRAIGSGATVVFIHGAGGSGQLFANQFQAFRNRFRSYFVDLPGHGKSPPISEPRISSYADSVAAFLAGLEKPITLVGHSMGGAVALELALRRKDLLQRLALVGTGCQLPVPKETLEGLSSDYPTYLARIVGRCFSQNADPEFLQRAASDIERNHPEIVRADFYACAGFDVCEEAATIDIPALIICGSLDRMTPLHLSERLHKLLRGSRLEIVPGGSHMTMVEQASTFNAVLETL